MNAFADIAADLAFLDDWDDRYKYLIDLGRTLPPFPPERRDEAHRVKGCASQVWLHVERDGADGLVRLRADSDSHLVKGLAALIVSLFEGRSPDEIATINVDAALTPLDLAAHLTPQRSNGLASMVRVIRERARAFAAPSQSSIAAP